MNIKETRFIQYLQIYYNGSWKQIANLLIYTWTPSHCDTELQTGGDFRRETENVSPNRIRFKALQDPKTLEIYGCHSKSLLTMPNSISFK